jgi:hypothetical protein
MPVCIPYIVLPQPDHFGAVFKTQPVHFEGQRCPRIRQVEDPQTDQAQLLQILPVEVDPTEEWKRHREDVLKNPVPQRPTPEPPLPR